MPIGGRTDKNQALIVEALRKAGVSVLVTSHVGGGFPDAIAHYPRTGKTVFMEFKQPKKRDNLTPAQRKLMAEFPVVVITTPREALAAVGIEVSE